MRSHAQLTENAISIYSRLNFAGILDSDDLVHYDALGEIVDYVMALALAVFAADGHLGDDEAELLASFSSAVNGVGSGIPTDNHLRWAETKLQESKDFLKLAALLDRENNSCVALSVLWHILRT